MQQQHSEEFRRLGATFAHVGDAYERLRPGYPEAAVSVLLAGSPVGAAVVDVGAGTGKLTAAIAARGFRVTAVDPSADMLAQLESRLPAVRTRIGTGEHTGLPDRSVDLVTFAQSWHWVEPTAGVVEMLRILRPGGRAGWIWNFMDVRVPWVAELGRIWHTVSGSEAVDAGHSRPELHHPFGPVATSTVDWTVPMSRDDLVDLVTTRSYYLNAPVDDQTQIRAQVSDFVASQFPDAGTVELPYRTHCFTAAVTDS